MNFKTIFMMLFLPGILFAGTATVNAGTGSMSFASGGGTITIASGTVTSGGSISGPIQHISAGSAPSETFTSTQQYATGNNLIFLGGTGSGDYISNLSQTNVSWVLVSSISASALGGGARDAEIWVAYNVPSNAGLTLTVSAFGGNNTRGDLSEWSGMKTSVAVDAQGTLTDITGNSYVSSTTVVTPSVSGDLCVASMEANPSGSFSSGPSNSWTQLYTVAGDYNNSNSAYLLNAAVSSQSTTWTYTGGTLTGYGTSIACFKHQ